MPRALSTARRPLTEAPGPVFLTPEELVELTHAKRRDTQIRALRLMGIEYKLRPNGTPAVLCSHIEKVFGGVQTEKPVERAGTQPNWAALDEIMSSTARRKK